MASVVAAIKARDELARDVFADAANEEDMGRSASLSLDTVPDGVAFVDWVAVLSILSRQTGTIDLRRDYDGEKDEDAPRLAFFHHGDGGHGDGTDDGSWSYKTNEGGRVVQLIVGRGVFYLQNMTPEVVATEVVEAIKERDRSMRDAVAETDEEDRGRLMTVCVSICPHNVSFIDFVVVISSLSRGGIINLEGDDKGVGYFDFGTDMGFGDGWLYLADEDGRITELNVGGDAEDEDGIHDIPPYDLPAGVSRLQELNSLEVIGNCRSLPVADLCGLPHLQELCLNRCSDLLEKFPLGMMLPRLKRLYVRDCRLKSTSSSRLFKWMASQLPVLETLAFHYIEETEPDCVLTALTTLDFRFQNSLKRINFIGCNDLADHHLETLLLQISTKFPNVSYLDLEGNNIRSVRPVVDKIKTTGNDDGNCFISKSIRCLDLNCNPIMENVRKDPEEKRALLSFLQTFNTICKLGVCDYDPEVEYALRMNQAGRGIVEVGGGTDNRSLSLSVWPIVLERSYSKSSEIYHRRGRKNATGLYYLLRDGPALIGRPELTSITAMDFDNNIEDGVDSGASTKPSKRRRIEKS